MSWRILVINEHSKLSYQNNNLIFKSNDTTEKLHLSEIHTVMLETTNITITTALVYKMLENNVKLIDTVKNQDLMVSADNGLLILQKCTILVILCR